MTDTSAAVIDGSAIARPPVWPMFRAVVGVGVGCALVIVMVYEFTRPIIQEKRQQMLQRAILNVLPGAETTAAFYLDDDGQFDPVALNDERTNLVYAGFDANRTLVGVAIRAQGMGYQDWIRLLYGYSPDAQAVIGIRVLESRETPGLGDRIENDEQYLLNFEKLDVQVTPDGTQLANRIQFVKPGEKTDPWQIDGISGATISSEAVADMLSESTSQWIPRIRERLGDFVTEGGQ